MTQWGRSADALPGVVATGRLGKRSIMLALAAFAADAIVFTAMVLLPSGTSEVSPNVVTGVFMTIFLLAAPLAHIAGVIFGLMALARSNDSRLLGLVGVLAQRRLSGHWRRAVYGHGIDAGRLYLISDDLLAWCRLG